MVDSTKDVPPGMLAMEIPADNYAVFTTDQGEIPGIIMNTWKKIWALESGKEIRRKYGFDYEVYDDRAADPKLCSFIDLRTNG
jgi:predicted transcriptional regulator YdeE